MKAGVKFALAAGRSGLQGGFTLTAVELLQNFTGITAIGSGNKGLTPVARQMGGFSCIDIKC